MARVCSHGCRLWRSYRGLPSFARRRLAGSVAVAEDHLPAGPPLTGSLVRHPAGLHALMHVWGKDEGRCARPVGHGHSLAGLEMWPRNKQALAIASTTARKQQEKALPRPPPRNPSDCASPSAGGNGQRRGRRARNERRAIETNSKQRGWGGSLASSHAGQGHTTNRICLSQVPRRRGRGTI